MKQISIVLVLTAASGVAVAKSESKPTGLHTSARILLPIDSGQKENYLFHSNRPKQPPINAPLVTLEQVPEPGKKYKKLKLKTSLDAKVLDENQD